MMPTCFSRLSFAALIACACLPASALALSQQALEARVNDVIAPLIKQQQIPGMAVAVIYRGRTQFFYYGLANVKTRQPVSGDTLFELGSLSKTFTGIAGGYAAASGEARLDAPAADYAPMLKGAPWGDISLLQLATYTAGGLPLQLPDEVTSEASLWRYYQGWKPEYAPGSVRQYSNASIGLFGVLAVKNSGLSFDQFMQQRVLMPLKLAHTFINVPAQEAKNYAWGYRDGKPIRVSPGMLDAEAYGIKTTITDMATFVQANIDGEKLKSGDPLLAKAVAAAQSGYYKIGDMYQGLGWEAWPMPVDAGKLIAASDNAAALKPAPAVRQTPARPLGPGSLLHKTGSTNGFGAYAAFIPQREAGVIMLANKNYPNPQRVAAAWQILRHLD